MLKPRPSRIGSAIRVARKRNLAPRTLPPAPPRPKSVEAEPQTRAQDKLEWADPLNEEELAALDAGWGFVE
jgi:hypothetical protein